MAGVRFEGLRKVWPGGAVALHGLDLDVGDGELLVLVGPSGCGKSTALRLVAGLERASAGRLWIGEREVSALSPQERDVAMVFQSYALYPHKTVRENLAFALRLRRLAPSEIARRVEAAAARLDLAAFLERRPAALSGGQRQRVALGRALVREPAAFLLDEPLSNLDAALRARTRAELARLHAELGATMLYVTHDQEEAMTLGDRIAVLRDGRLHQVGPPLEVYERPADVFVAGFIGSPAMNLLEAELVAEGATLRACARGLAAEVAPGLEGGHRGAVVVGLRPRAFELVDPERAGTFPGRVEVVELLGPEQRLHLRLAGGMPLVVSADLTHPFRVGETVGVRVRVPPERLHLFDAATGLRIQG